MGDPAYPVDPEVVQDLLCVERCSTFLGSGPLRPEFWEVFALLKSDRPLVVEEVKRLTELRASGRPATISMELTEKLLDVRRDLYGIASDLRPFLSKNPGMRDGMRLELALVFIMSSARGREAAAQWVADPAAKVKEASPRVLLMGRMADAYCRALMEARRNSPAAPPEPPASPAPAPPPAVPSPQEEPDIILKPSEEASIPSNGQPDIVLKPADETPPAPPSSGVASAPAPSAPAVAKPAVRVTARLHPQFLEDLELVQRLQRALEGPKPPPSVWEAHALVSQHVASLPGQ